MRVVNRKRRLLTESATKKHKHTNYELASQFNSMHELGMALTKLDSIVRLVYIMYDKNSQNKIKLRVYWMNSVYDDQGNYQGKKITVTDIFDIQRSGYMKEDENKGIKEGAINILGKNESVDDDGRGTGPDTSKAVLRNLIFSA